jgi:hypothetical protein
LAADPFLIRSGNTKVSLEPLLERPNDTPGYCVSSSILLDKLEEGKENKSKHWTESEDDINVLQQGPAYLG